MAFGYVTTSNNLVRWFPRHKGLAFGIAVSGFGGGAILLSQIARFLLNSGWIVMDIFRAAGIIYAVLLILSALAISTPAWYRPHPEEMKVNLRELLRDRRFWVLFYVFFAGSFAGLVFSGNIKLIGQSYGVGEWAAVLSISLFSIGNASGRIIWGQLHDMLGGRKTVITALSLLAVFTLLLLVGSSHDATFLILTFLVGVSYGANFVTYASDTADIWGIAKLDIIYPAVSIGYGLAGIVGPMLGGFICDITGTYYIAIIVSALVCLSGMVVYARRPERGELEKSHA
jgi:OFA family oxalate/formate antiporter-like MFS transporter